MKTSTRRVSDDELIAVSRRFPDKRELRSKANSVYQELLRRKLQDRAFAHMPKRVKPTRFDFNNMATG